MGESAEFKLAFFGLQPELQAEVRKYLRQNRLRQLELERLFAVAQDAEVGLTGRSGRRGNVSQEGLPEKQGPRKPGGVSVNAVMLDATNENSGGTKKGCKQADRCSDVSEKSSANTRGSTNSSWKSSGSQRTENWRNDNGNWGQSRGSASTSSGGRNGRERSYDVGGNALCFICDKDWIRMVQLPTEEKRKRVF